MYRASTLLLCCATFSLLSPARAADPPQPPPELMREFRGIWVATVGNIDWPSKPGLPTETQKAELLAIIDKTKRLGANALIFQIRPMCDALYESKLEPWSGYLTGVAGQSPGYDPLQFAIEECHRVGIELHAWFNPYRALSPTYKGELPANHIVRQRPDLAKPYGKHHWMNPTHPEVQKHSLAVMMDVVQRYDIDGIHIDDYFYPYKEKDEKGTTIPFPDDDTWQTYKQSGGQLNRDDWRRDAVNQFVERMYRETKAIKPWVKVGISPFGIWRPGYPTGIVGYDQYSELYADAKLWLNQGWLDYWTPQLYWPIAQEKQSFPKLLSWWSQENTMKRHLWPGLYTGRVTGADKGWPAKEITDQIMITREQSGCDGAIHFSMKTLLKNVGGVADAVSSIYANRAIVPITSWVNIPAPDVPQLHKQHKGLSQVKIVGSANTRFFAIHQWQQGRWHCDIVGLAADNSYVLAAQPSDIIYVEAIGMTGKLSRKVRID